jgi:hypothetical protein
VSENPLTQLPDPEWFLEAWREREKCLTEAYGESLPPGAPPGTVIGLPPELQAVDKIPGGSVYMFPPKPEAKRPFWIFATLGLSQPQKRDDVKPFDEANPAPSRLGLEVGFAVKEPANWTVVGLFALAQFSLSPPAPMKPGARVPCFFTHPTGEQPSLENVAPVFGQPPPGNTIMPGVVALVLWPALDRDGPFVTKTGRFDLMIGTGITMDEWEAAKATSSMHLLWLFQKAGIGQSTDPFRKSVFEDENNKKEWESIKALTGDQILDLLYGPA